MGYLKHIAWNGINYLSECFLTFQWNLWEMWHNQQAFLGHKSSEHPPGSFSDGSNCLLCLRRMLSGLSSEASVPVNISFCSLESKLKTEAALEWERKRLVTSRNPDQELDGKWNEMREMQRLCEKVSYTADTERPRWAVWSAVPFPEKELHGTCVWHRVMSKTQALSLSPSSSNLWWHFGEWMQQQCLVLRPLSLFW